MPRPSFRRAAPVLPTALAVLLIPTLAGCFYSRRAADVDRNPTVDTGTGASIIMPGQSAPAMGRAPGSEGGIPTATPNIQMIGGSEIDEERHEVGKEDPLLFKALTAPLAAVAAPFVAAAEALRDDDPEPGPQVPAHKPERPEVRQGPPPVDSKGGASAAAGGPAPPTVQATRTPDFETQQIEAMERELTRRQASAPPPSPAPSAAPRSRGAVSIADELAALQRAPRAASQPAPAVPPPLETTLDPARRPSGGSEGPVADGIVDRDEDGRIDLWLYREDGDIVRKVIDQDFDGRPDTTLHYDPDTHRLARIEEDSDRNGATDSWTEYREGEVTRRRVDSDHDGSVDTWTFYRDGEISRHEQDTTGDGFRDRIGHYEGGTLLREEHDRNGDGRPDLTEHYADGRNVSRREEDRDHDGAVDVISHYENGRLARRELLGDAETTAP